MKSEISKRIDEVIKKAGGQTAISEKTGIPLKSISNYCLGISPPKLEPLIQIAKATNVSLDWLATGEEPPEAAVKYNPDAVDADLLKDVIELVDSELRWDNPEQKALICTKIYAYMTKKRANGLQKESEKAEIIDLMEILKSAG